MPAWHRWCARSTRKITKSTRSDRQVTLTEIGEAHVEEILDMPLRDPDRPEDITPEQARILGYLEQALRAEFLYQRNKEYLDQAARSSSWMNSPGGRCPAGAGRKVCTRPWKPRKASKIEPENVTYATITIQNYFRMYEKLAGMTGTAVTEAEEFAKIYKLEVLPIPTNLEYVADVQIPI